MISNALKRGVRREANSSFFSGILVGLTVSIIFYNIHQTQRIASNLLTKLHREHLTKRNNELDEIKVPLSIIKEGSKNKNIKGIGRKVKVLCVVITSPKDHEERAIHVKRTWGKRCNKLIFASSQEDRDLGAIALDNVKEGHENLWGKTKQAFKFIYENHFHEADWFLKADVDTYVILENLRLMLKDLNPEIAYYHGCKFSPHVKQGYMSGGAGYVLSKETLRKLVKVGLPNATACKADDDGDEDVELGRCLENLGINGGDSRDEFGRYRFNSVSPEILLFHNPSGWQYNEWYSKFIFYPQMLEADCCSDAVISFHYITPPQMYAMDYFIYRVNPYRLN